MQIAEKTENKRIYMLINIPRPEKSIWHIDTRDLKGYWVGFNVRRNIELTWTNITLIPKKAGFYLMPFKVSRGVSRGGVISPIIFNIVTDAVFWESITHKKLQKWLYNKRGTSTIPNYAEDE